MNALHPHLLVLIFLSCPLCLAGKRTFRGPAEHTIVDALPKMADRSRLSDSEWLSIVTTRKDELYRIRPGDTLWGISQRMFSQPGLWRKLWQINPELLNPHELTVGQMLRLYREGERAPAGETIRIPVVRLRPPGAPGKAAGVEDTASPVMTGEVRDRLVPRVVVLAEEEKYAGQITGSSTHKEGITEHDELFVELFDEKTSPNTKFTVVREDRDIRDTTKLFSPYLGTLGRVVGEVEIQGKGERLFRGAITAMYGQIKRGDKLMPLVAPIDTDDRTEPPDDFQANVVGGEESSRNFFAQGELVLINKGSTGGMKLGFVFRVFKDIDSREKSTSIVEPYHKGEVQIVQTGPDASVGFVVRNTEPIEPGDRLVAYQLFPDRPPPPTRESSTLQID